MVSPAVPGETMSFPAEGYGILPAGWMVAAVTWLEMTVPPTEPAAPLPADVVLEPIRGDAAGVARYRALFRAVGEDWLWFGRTAMRDADLSALLDAPATWCRAVVRDGVDIGLVELDASRPGEVELAYFGVVPAAVGTGLGRALMGVALAEAWSRAPERVTVHTCHFDHPGALGFYRRSGFVAVKQGVELGPDPRLTGVLPRTAAPQIPLIEP